MVFGGKDTRNFETFNYLGCKSKEITTTAALPCGGSADCLVFQPEISVPGLPIQSLGTANDVDQLVGDDVLARFVI